MAKLPLALLDAMGVRPTSERPLRTLGFAGRAEMLALWDRLGAEKQTLVLEMVRDLVRASDE